MQPTQHLFVYGTLRPDVTGILGTPQRARLAAEAEHLGTARAAGRLILLSEFGWYPGLIDEPGEVIGHLFRLSTPAPTLAWLDAFEAATGTPDDDYVRVLRPVTHVTSAAPIDAWLYLLVGQGPIRGPVIPSGDWKTSPRAKRP